MGRRYEQLSLEDRCEIARLQADGCSVRQIAAALDRPPSTISRELKGGHDRLPFGFDGCLATPSNPLESGSATGTGRLDSQRLSGDYDFRTINTPEYIRTMALAIARARVLPELEVFDVGHLRLALHLLEAGAVKTPVLFQICLGVPLGAPATSETMTFMRGLLPKDCV